MSKNTIDLLLKIGMVVFCLAIWSFIGWAILNSRQTPKDAPEQEIIPKADSYCLIEQNSLKAITNPITIKPQVLGMMADGLAYEQAKLLDKIAECESGWRNVCNAKGCRYGQGIFQLVPSTVRYCEEKLGRKINPLDEEDNKECAVWLLTNEGVEHWGCPACDWGTYWCWAI